MLHFKSNLKKLFIFHLFLSENNFILEEWKTALLIYSNFLQKPSKIDVYLLSYLLPFELI